jgi:predicted Zn finger-like uncharacterized protein
MKTRCPYCDTRYDIDEQTLQATDGLARCHRCEGIFNAYEQFLPDLGAPAPAEPASAVDVDRLASRLRPDTSAPTTAADELPPAPPPPRPIPRPAAEPEPVAEAWDRTLIDLDGTRPRHGLLRGLAGIMAIALLGTGALAQWAWQERNWVLAQAELRPHLELACAYLDCRVPLPSDPQRFEVIRRSLSPTTSPEGALALAVTFRNTAGFAQPLPRLELSLFDTRQQLLARRGFAPGEYLGEAKLPEVVRPGEVVATEILLEDPGPSATGFELAFR